MRTFTPILLIVLSGAVPSAAQKNGAPALTSKTFERWLDFIKPSKDELAYERIGWRNRFWPAVEEARELGRPILLWTMNGHPLGCT